MAYVASLREEALGFPEAWADHPWDHWVAKVRKKVFVFLDQDHAIKGAIRMSLKLPHTGDMALSLPFATPTGYGLGKAGWVSFSMKPQDVPPISIAKAWLRESYVAVAPKTLAQQLPSEGA